MFLNFIGSGSALNTALGNNCAFIKKGESLLMIDCGSTAFSRIQSLDLLKDIKYIYVLITHRHPDHISSLGDLIFYCRYIINAEINVMTPDAQNVAQLLMYMGVHRDLYKMTALNQEIILKNNDFNVKIAFVQVLHVEDMECYGYIIRHEDTSIYYSGDAMAIPKDVLKLFEENKLDYMYQDICSYDYPNNPHMCISNLYKLINEKDRHRVFCMHFDERLDIDMIVKRGFRQVINF